MELGELRHRATVASVQVLGDELDVRFFERAAIYTVPRSADNFETLKARLEAAARSGQRVLVTAVGTRIVGVEEADGR